MDNICKICGELVVEDSHYYKTHKTKISDYYFKYFPRFDLFTKEPIKFKSKDSYFLTDFVDKRNLKKYLESISKEEGINYLKNWLLRRKESKNLVYSMGEFECRSLCFPSIKYIEKYYGEGTYNKICLELGLKIKYDYNNPPETTQNKDLEYIIDSREQSILPIKNFQIHTLNYGDYTTKDNKGIYIERKSLSDTISTISQGYKRFQREIERCKNNNGYLIILIEEKFSNLQSFEYMPHIHSKCNWDFISHRIRELLYKYPLTIQFLCSDGRKEAVRLIDKIFNYTGDIKKLDLQYYYNSKIF